MKNFARTLVIAALSVSPVVFSGCVSGDEGALTTEAVVPGAPLTIINPTLVGRNGAGVVTGTIENVTGRTIEITSVSSSTGDIEFRSADDSLLASLTIDPNSSLTLDTAGVHLALIEAIADDSVDVVFGLDIQDSFEFTASREGE